MEKHHDHAARVGKTLNTSAIQFEHLGLVALGEEYVFAGVSKEGVCSPCLVLDGDRRPRTV
jgi:hypothetical protein